MLMLVGFPRVKSDYYGPYEIPGYFYCGKCTDTPAEGSMSGSIYCPKCGISEDASVAARKTTEYENDKRVGGDPEIPKFIRRERDYIS